MTHSKSFLKNFQIAISVSILLITFFGDPLAWAQTQTSEKVPAIQVSSLGQYRGQFLNLLFVEASNSVVSFDPFRLDVREVKIRPQQVKIEGPEVRFKASEIPKRPFKLAYNFVLIVVSPYPDFSWIDSDGSRPLPVDFNTSNTTKNFFKAIPRNALIYSAQDDLIKISIAE